MHDSLRKWQSAIIVFLLVFTIFAVPPGGATDQASSRISSIQIPANTYFRGLAWNEDNYTYAIAVGANSSYKDSHGVESRIFKFEPDKINNPEHGWTNLTSSVPYVNGIVFYDITYIGNDSFFIFGDSGGESMAYILTDASTSPKFLETTNVESAGGGFTSGCYDRYYNGGSVVAVGTPYKNYGMISWYDLVSDEWNMLYLKKTVGLNGVACDDETNTSYVIAVGYDSATNRAAAYLFDYSKVYPIHVPDDAENFTSVVWDRNDDSFLISGYDHNGTGKVWKMHNIRQTAMIAFSNYDSNALSTAYGEGRMKSWIISYVDSVQYSYPSIGIDWHGTPHIMYRDASAQALKHAWYDKGWKNEVVDSSGNTGYYSSIAFDKFNKIHASYCEWNNRDLEYITNNGGSWASQTVDSSGDVGSWTSIALERRNIYAYPCISYVDDTNKDIKYAYESGGSWYTDSLNSGTNSDKEWTSLYLDYDNSPSISYYDTGGIVKYAAYDGSWHIENVTDSNTGYTDMDVWAGERVGISFIDAGGLCYSEKQNGGSWETHKDIFGASDYTSIAFDIRGDPVIAYHASSGLNLARFYHSNNTWENKLIFAGSNPQNNGKYNDIVLGVKANFIALKGTDSSAKLYGIAYEPTGKLAIAVGDGGETGVYYPGEYRVSDWSDPSFSGNLMCIAVKPQGSPGYGLALGGYSSGSVISYQTYNTNTVIRGTSSTPRINNMSLFDQSGTYRLNKQSDVGSTYTFFINASYDLGWTKVGGIDLYAWYDFGKDNLTLQNYNYTKGKNCNFYLHFTPDSSDPVNNKGVWTLLWPNGTDEVILKSWYQRTEDRQGFGGSTPGSDEYDYFLLYVNVSFGMQILHAPGNRWLKSTNQSDPTKSLNDINSWNLNITIYDKDNSAVHESKYDEFGIYAYTEISVQNNPSGSGAPGSLVYLSPPTKLGVRSNLPYKVLVNISDMAGQHNSSHSIARKNVHVLNNHPDANTTNSGISSWTAFQVSGDPLYVWGRETYYMPNLCNGTWSAGLQGGYSTDTTYTYIYWDVSIPPGTPDDTYQSVVEIEITY